MATWDDVRGFAMALPETTERAAYGSAAWRVKDKLFVWERPLRKTELAELGDAAPDGPILGALVTDLGDKQALIQRDPDVFFTTAHFDGFPAVLIRLDRLDVNELSEIVTDAWLIRAPKRLAQRYLDGNADS